MKYATAYDGKSMARAVGIALPVSMKKAVEVCSFIRGRELSKAIRLLESVQNGKIAVPFRRYGKGGTGHKPGKVGPGKYPMNVCFEVVKLLKQAAANARNKGLDAQKLVLHSIVAKQGPASWHFGRHLGRRRKLAHVEVVVSELEAGAGKAAATKSENKAGQK